MQIALAAGLFPLLMPALLYLLPDNRKLIFSVGLLVSMIGCAGISFAVYSVWVEAQVPVWKTDWFHLKNGLTFELTFRADLYASLLGWVTLFLATLIHIYAYQYLNEEKNYRKFTAFFLSFAGAMTGLVLSDNLLMLFIFWEWIGVCSYFLIGFWHKKAEARFSSAQAFLYNRFADVFLLSGILYLGTNFNTFSLSELPIYFSGHPFHPAVLLIFIGVLAKSAQIPLQAWLPNAMTGPTPVSALLHSATLVAAGVFLMIRISPLMSAEIKFLAMFIGTLTAVYGALKACNEFRLKRIWAYSSMSQLGMMTAAVGFGYPEIAFLHLITHAFFKSLLFLTSGTVLHYLEHINHSTDDIRLTGGLRKKLPYTFILMALSAAALSGVPLTAGFLSKEGILTAGLQWALEHPQNELVFSVLSPALLFITSGMTAFYSFRAVYLIFIRSSVNPNTSGYIPHFSLMTAVGVVIALFISAIMFNPLNIFDFESVPLLKRIHPELSFEFGNIALVASLTVLMAGLGAVKLLKIPSVTPEISQSNAFNKRKMFKFIHISEHVLQPQISYIITRAAVFIHKNIENRLLDKIVVGTAEWVDFKQVWGTNVSLSSIIRRTDEHLTDGAVRKTGKLTISFGKIFKGMQTGKVQAYFIISLLFLGFLVWKMYTD